MSVYKRAIEDKKLAGQILLPLIEFEFGFIGNDSPTLTQSPINKEQFLTMFEICKKHGWIVSDSYKMKGKNLFFRLSKKGFREIFEIAGPFSNGYKNKWASLILERQGKIGGYQVNKEKTEEKLLEILKKSDWVTLQKFCLTLRLMPPTVREGIKKLKHEGLLERKVTGKAAYWRLRR